MEPESSAAIQPMITLVSSLAALGFTLFIAFSLVHALVKCQRCKIRLASIKIRRLERPTAARLERLGEGAEYLDSRVCSTCWDTDISQYDYPSIDTSWAGALIPHGLEQR